MLGNHQWESNRSRASRAAVDGISGPTRAISESGRLDAGFESANLSRHALEGGQNHVARPPRNAGGLERRSEACQIGFPFGMKPGERLKPRRWRRHACGIEHGLIVVFQFGGGAEQRR
jgi:hypothetical protein